MRTLALFALLLTPDLAPAQYRVWTRYAQPWGGFSDWSQGDFSHPPDVARAAAGRFVADGYQAVALPEGARPPADDGRGLQDAARLLSGMRANPPAAPHANAAEPLGREPDVLSRHNGAAQTPAGVATLDDVLAAIGRVDGRLANTEAGVVAITKRMDKQDERFHDFEARLLVLERGQVPVARAFGTLTDPLAARTAGRVAGVYDQFGRLLSVGEPLPPGTFSGVVQSTPTAAFATTSSFAAPAALSQPFLSASFSGYSAGMSAGGCAGGSCGAGGRRGLFGRRR